MDDGVIVALAGLPSRTLGRVVAFGEPAPHRGRMKSDAEFPANQFDDPAGAPEVGAKSVFGRLLRQPRFDLPLLVGGQKSGPPRRGFGGQPVFPLRPMPGHPFGDGDGMDAEPLGHARLRSTGQNTRDRLSPQRFQCGS